MADISITAANVIKGSGGTTITGTAGASISAGDIVYKDTADNKLKLADCNDASSVVRTPLGIALNSASTGQPVTVQTSGSVTVGSVLTKGLIYVLSATPGKIAPAADLTAGYYTSVIGVATSASALQLGILASGASV